MLAELVLEEGLQFGEGGGGVLAGEPFFEGLVEAFDLAAGLRVVGARVLVGDPSASSSVSITTFPPRCSAV